MFSDFFGVKDDTQYFGVEIVKRKGFDLDIEKLVLDFKEFAKAKNLFDGDILFEGYHVVGNAYPVYTKEALELSQAMIAELESHGIRSAGRQGRFEYLPTARQVTLQVEKFI